MMRVYTRIAFRNDRPSIGGRDRHKNTGDLVFPEGCSAGGGRVRRQKSRQHEEVGRARRLLEWDRVNESMGLVVGCNSRQHNRDRDHHECSRMHQPPAWWRLWSPSVGCDRHECVLSGFQGVSTVHVRPSFKSTARMEATVDHPQGEGGRLHRVDATAVLQPDHCNPALGRAGRAAAAAGGVHLESRTSAHPGGM